MRPEQVDWRSGKVAFWNMDFLDLLKPLMDQVADLKEDLAQVRYEGGILVDIGWYPEFSGDGEFSVRVVQEADWDEPLFQEEHRSLDGLLACLAKAVLIAEAAGASG